MLSPTQKFAQLLLSDVFEKLVNCRVLIWHFAAFAKRRMLMLTAIAFSRQIIGSWRAPRIRSRIYLRILRSLENCCHGAKTCICIPP